MQGETTILVYTPTCKQKLMPPRAIHMKAWIMDTMTPITAFCLKCIEQMLAAHLRLSVQGEMKLLNTLLAVFLVFSDFCFQRCMRGGKRCLIAWEKPPDSWVKINVDGAAQGNPGNAGMGGLIRDASGCWLEGFSVFLGISSNIVAELWAILKGLQLAWDRGYKQVILESDSKAGLSLIADAEVVSTHFNLVKQIRDMMHRNWECELKHIWREANNCADWLAKESVRQQASHVILQVPPAGMRSKLARFVSF